MINTAKAYAHDQYDGRAYRDSQISHALRIIKRYLPATRAFDH